MENINFKIEHIFLDKPFEVQEEFFKWITEEMLRLGHVEDSFYHAIVEREKIFPTGLPAVGGNVAIPHCDSKHIKQSFISVVRLLKPIEFREMATESNVLPVQIIFVLGFQKHDESQIELLQMLVKACMKENFVGNLINAKDEEELLMFMNSIRGDNNE